MALTEQSLKKIDGEIAKYPAGQKQSAVMAALRIAQEQIGWLSPEAIEAVAGYLEMAPMAVYEVASFYNMYDLAPVGKYKLTVCTNLPCALSGGVHAAEYLKQKLGIDFNETTPDGKFTHNEGECMGACGDAPLVIVNNIRLKSFMTPEAIDRLLEECK
jgi:NADH-quinone oxidoreductase subunit E